VPCCTFVTPDPWAIPPEGVGHVGTRGRCPLRRDRDDRPGRQDRRPGADQVSHGGGGLGQLLRVEGIGPLSTFDPGSGGVAAVGGPAAQPGALLVRGQPLGPRLAAAEPATRDRPGRAIVARAWLRPVDLRVGRPTHRVWPFPGSTGRSSAFRRSSAAMDWQSAWQ
jgi:hypothetical protein